MLGTLLCEELCVREDDLDHERVYLRSFLTGNATALSYTQKCGTHHAINCGTTEYIRLFTAVVPFYRL